MWKAWELATAVPPGDMSHLLRGSAGIKADGTHTRDITRPDHTRRFRILRAVCTYLMFLRVGRKFKAMLRAAILSPTKVR
jgi:hypothetical protein